jgi:RHS repeat-associated protein
MTTDHAPAEPSDCNDCSEGPRLPRHVRLATGELVWQQEDIRIAGRGIDFAWTRTYRSRPDNGAPHWDNAYNLKAESAGEDINVFNGAGAANLYRPQPGGGYAALGVFAEGRLDSSNQFRIRFAGGGAWEFRSLDEPRAPGRIARIVDRNGNTLRFGYGATGEPAVITDTLGRDILLRYDRAGRLATITDFTGRRLSYRYTQDGDLESVTYPPVMGTPIGNDFPNGATVTYTYSAPHLLIGITDRAGDPLLDIEYSMAFDHQRVSALRWGRSGNPTHFTYHPPTGEDHAAVVAIVNDGNGNVRDLLFDEFGACVGARDYTARADAAIPTGRTENRPVHPLRSGEPPFYDTRYHYDNPDGLLTRIVRADGSTVDKQFEIDLRPDASPIERGNLRLLRHTPGAGGGDTPELVRRYEYLPGFGCTCGQAFVTRETDPRGSVRSTGYDDRGNPLLVVERDGGRTENSYNAFGDLAARWLPGESRRDTFEYSDRHGQLVTETLDVGGLAITTAYEYDQLGRLVLLRDPAGHDHRHAWNAWDLMVRRVLPHDAGAGSATEDISYDANLRAVGRIVRESGREVVEARTYDVQGRLRSVSRESERGHRVVTAYDYDDNGNRIAVRRGAAHVARLSYDAFNRPLRRVRGERGKGLRETAFDYDAVGNLTRVTRGSGTEVSITTGRYDGYGRTTAIVAPNGTTVGFSHDANGNVLRQAVLGTGEEPLAEVKQTFDAMDRLTRRSTSGPGVSHPAVESWEFDGRSRLVRRIDAAGRSWQARYDALDRVIEVDDGTGRVTTHAYDRNSNVVDQVTTDASTGLKTHVKYVRDARGRTLEEIAPQGMSRTYEYGSHDRPGTIGLPGDRRISVDWDGRGRPTTVGFTGPDDSDAIAIQQVWSDSSPLVARADPNGNTTRYHQDAAGKVVQVEHPDGTMETYSFDSRGNCAGWTDPNGTEVINTYDQMDRLVRRIVKPGAGVAADTTTESYAYDELGRMILAKNDRHRVEWRYDALGRVAVQVQDGRSVTSTYDEGGRRTSIGYPSGYRLDFDYEDAELRRIRDPRGAAVELRSGGTTVFPRTRGPVFATVGWNSIGLPERLVTMAGENVLDERRYRWDASANVTGIEITDAHGRHDVSYTVDSLDRLRASATSEGRRVEYRLDSAGNRTVVRVDDEEGRYSLGNGVDRLTNRYSATPVDRRTYDANGNLLTVTDERGNRKTMRYDYLNRMVEFRDEASGSVAHYGYDCLGRRLTKSVSDVNSALEIRYTFDADVIIEEKNGDATRSLVRAGRFVYGMVGAEPKDARWFCTDLVGSIVAEVDESGAITRSHAYGDFGQLPPDDGGTPPVSFAGYTHDAESGLYYVRSRYLEPAAGRFTTRDPAGVWEDGRNRGNAYAYAGNNPVTFVDPTGRSTYRWYSCVGPWPGPRTIKVEFEGCSRPRRDAMSSPVCRAFRASGQSADRVLSLWLNDFTGVPQSGAEITRSRVKKWFGGPDNATNSNSKFEIYGTLDDVFDATTSDDFDIDCEGGSGTCASANAYVAWGGEDINVCNNFFNTGKSASKQASILIHELTHAYNDTDDYFYYPTDGSNLPWNAVIETPTLRENADTYEQFTLDFFLP